MCATKVSRLFRWACVVAFAVAPMAAFAQAPATVLVACQNAGNCPTGGHNSPYTDLQVAIDDAVADAVALDQQILLLVVGGPWVGNFTIPADANVHILGLTFNTQQTITIVPDAGGVPALGGTYTLSFTSPLDGSTDTTNGIAPDATAATVQAELEALTTIGAGNVTVTGPDGGPYDVIFTGALAQVVVPIIVPDDTNLLPVDAFVLVLSADGPFSTIIEDNDGTGVVLTIDGSTPESRDAGVGRDRLIVEGLTFRNGDRGIRVNGGSDTTAKIEPVLNRLYIRDNGAAGGDAGIAVEGSARPLIVNSSISENNNNGISILDGAGPGLADADILHCTIVDNDDNGVFVSTGNTATVRNTLVYENGSGTTEGGLVWENNPFIEPDFGPLDGLDPGTGNPLLVDIFGSNLLETAPTLVNFGPVSNPATAAIVPYGAQTDAQLSDVQLPPAYNGIPGPVDVTLRRSDGAQIVVPNGFSYTADVLGALVTPVVWQVDPGWGPLNSSDRDVYVLGAFFDRDCSVFFDLDDDDAIDANEQSPRVQWLSPGRLYVRVPSHNVAVKVDVFVRNNLTGQVSPAGPLEDYEYRAIIGLGPEIIGIAPNRIDTTAGTAGSSAEQPEIFGSNFATGVVVKIGGIVCPYESSGASVITNIVIPVSEFGAGGVYDVEVINPNGLNDILPRGFTYFADSTPRLDALPWRVSNFVERGTARTLSLLGHGLDFEVDLIENTTATVFGNNLQPIAQREIVFGYPADPSGLGLAATDTVVPIDVMNVGTESGSAPATPLASTNLIYTEVRTNMAPGAGRAVFFAINSVSIATVGATDVIQLDIENYRNSYNIFVGPEQVPAASITVITAPNPPGNYNGVIQFPAPVQTPGGVFGPVDIRVESPVGTTENQTGELLYTIAENAYSYRRSGTGQFPQVSAVTPNTVPDNGPQLIQFTGQNFIGPVASGVYTRVLLDGDATINGNELDLSAVAGAYSIDSISQITKVVDLDAVDPTTTIPRDVPVDVVVEQFDAVNGVVLDDGINPLRSRLIGAVTFLNAAPPTVASVVPNVAPVGGSDTGAAPAQILGANFGTLEPIVLIGSSQANVTGFTAATINFEIPAAPNGLPGIYDVTVIRTDDFMVASLVDDPATTAVESFVYYMDGAPIITDLSPNHTTYDPAAPPTPPNTVFVTIYGYNFDDEVRITFSDGTVADDVVFATNDSATQERINVISPNEIALELITSDFNGKLTGPEFVGGLATLQVTVQNQPTILSGTPEGASLTSAPEPFFVFSDARGDMEILMPELLYNDVYFNNQDDYVNVVPGAGSISVEPVILRTPWVGKLLPDPVSHPLLNTAGTFSDGEPYTLTDFELEARPQDDGPEIGADEILNALDLQVCSWYFANVTPSPVGVMPPSQLLVDLRFNGNCGGTPFIVPQGGDPRNTTDRIDLQLYQNPGNGYYIYTNADAITTVLDDRDGNNRPSIGDLIADGHAAVYMQRGSNIIGFDENALVPLAYEVGRVQDHLDEGGIIIDQAIEGRHFLIDTVPPRIHLEAYTAGLARTIDTVDISGGGVVSSNDSITALDHNPVTHPAGAPPAALPYRPSIIGPPFWHSDNGVIAFKPIDPFIDEGLQIFFNHGSISNPDPSGTVDLGATLDLVVSIELIDPPVTDPEEDTQAPVLGLDFYTGLLNRQTAGFPLLTGADDAVEAAGGAAGDNILLQGAARWFPDPSVSVTNGFAKTGQYLTTGIPIAQQFGDNSGVFDPSLAPGPSVPSPTATTDYENDLLTATWTINNLAPVSIDQAWHVIAQFVGEDLALNDTSSATTNSGADLYYDSFFFDPLHLWWMFKVESSLTGPSNCENTATPFYTASLRGNRPSHTGEPYPAFTYQLWSSPVCDGPFANTGIIAPWSISTSIDLLNVLTPAQQAALNNQYVMIVLLGADEAGNVESLPPPPPAFPFDPATYTGGALPANAKIFRFSNQRPPETAVNLELWYDLNDNGIIDSGEPVFGDTPIVTYHPQLRARYAVSVDSAGSAAGPFYAAWAFHEDGAMTLQALPGDAIAPAAVIGQFQSSSDIIPRVAPAAATPPSPGAPDITPTQNGFKLGNPTTAVTYLFTVAAYYDDAGTFVVDPTPASAYFVVVPGGVGDFVTSPEGADKQPIKEQGRE